MKASGIGPLVSVFLALSAPLIGCRHVNQWGTSNQSASVLYFPLEVDTLFPVTTENIRTRGEEILIGDRAAIDRLKEAIATDMDAVISSDSYTNQIVRVVIFDGKGKGPYAIIEADGACRLSTNRVIRLRPATLEAIRALLVRHLKTLDPKRS